MRNDAAKMLLDLKMAMGVDLDSPITLSDTLSFAPPTGDVAASVAGALRARPDTRAAQQRAAAARAQAAAVSGERQPQIYGAAMADAAKQRGMASMTGYTVGITISIPVFDAGQRSAQLEEARAMQAQAEAQVRQQELRAETEVRQAWLDVGTAAQNLRTAEAALVSAQAAYEVVRLRAENGKAIQLEQLDSLAALTQARANRAQALYDHASAAARLRRAEGKV